MSDMLTLMEMHNQIRVGLFDEAKRYWANREIVEAINDGRLRLYSMKPSVYEVTEPVTLIAGHRQKVPNDSTYLFRGIDNITASSQRGITPVSNELLTRVRPRWRTESASNEIVHLIYNEMAPTEYEVYPPARPGTQIRLSYAKRPTAFTLDDLDNPNPILMVPERSQASGLIDYAIHRCLLKESDSSPEAAARSNMYLQLAIATFNGESSGRAKSTPNTTAIGGQSPKVNQ